MRVQRAVITQSRSVITPSALFTIAIRVCRTYLRILTQSRELITACANITIKIGIAFSSSECCTDVVTAGVTMRALTAIMTVPAQLTDAKCTLVLITLGVLRVVERAVDSLHAPRQQSPGYALRLLQ